MLQGPKPGTFNQGGSEHIYQVVLTEGELSAVIAALGNQAKNQRWLR